MKKILFLIPPSEGKTSGGKLGEEKLSFHFEKPKKLANHASEKDLKCKGKRFEEAQELNKICAFALSPLGVKMNGAKLKKEIPWGGKLDRGIEVLPAIARYNGVMYSAIDYDAMSLHAKNIFDRHFLICSGMYGLVRSQDAIANYKLPIETKGLSHFWKEKITQTLNESEFDIIVDVLPGSYKKMIDWKKLHKKVIVVDFFEVKDGKKKKMTHGVKTVKGKWIKNLCEARFTEVKNIILEKISKGETMLEVLL